MPENLTISIQHPTNSAQQAKVSVSPEITPRHMVQEMVKASWIPQPGTGGQYKLRNTATGLQLLDDVGLAAAGVTTGADLVVDHHTTGA